MMNRFTFKVVYIVGHQLREAHFKGDDRNMVNADASMFADMLEERGHNFRVWSPDDRVIRQNVKGVENLRIADSIAHI